MTYKQAQQRYGIQGRSTVLVWLRKYGRLDWSRGLPDLVKRKLPVTQTTIPLTPEQRIRELEAQLELANQKAEFFESVINVLKNDYGVSIVKKRPGKSSRKVRPPKYLGRVHVCSWDTADRHGIRTTHGAENGRNIMLRFLILLPVSDVASPESVRVSCTIC